MRSVEADFNDLARGGKIRVLSSDVPDIHLGERVILVEEEEDMRLEAIVAEIDGDFVYFVQQAAHL